MKRVIIFGLVVAVLAGCASGPPRMQSNETLERYMSYASAPVDRFNIAIGIDSWESVDRNHIVLRTGVNKAYLVTIWDGCSDVDFAKRIRVVSALPSSVGRQDKVVVGRESCMIREIRPINVMQMKADQSTIRQQKTQEKKS